MHFSTIPALFALTTLAAALPQNLETRGNFLDQSKNYADGPIGWVELYSEKGYRGGSKQFYSQAFCVDLFAGTPNPDDKAWNNRAMAVKPTKCTSCRLFAAPACNPKDGFNDVISGQYSLETLNNKVSSLMCYTLAKC
ncbi:hypothetical protein CC80DRAFT_544869 [Byssothecium circinans]|uniref:Beta/gamma crystallin 'Greek key' domain-containing protein n=1 Tax=Byssothecium circinans TaxID=147558 RepID=A0A6A5U5J2_9PLEO|nr:hypothetical protein CC80DRAFT_544869 [Byssothecium circinans]